MRVTVITPSYNQDRFIERTLRSVSDQDHPDLEHLVMDGGSTDGTAAILRAAEAWHAKTYHWVSEPDGGQADAVNKGLARARGEIIGWLNSDDLYTPGAVRAAVTYLDAHPDKVAVYGEADWVDLDDQSLLPYPTQHGENGEAAPREALHQECFICQPSVFIRRSALEAIGGLDASIHTAMDYDLWMRLYRHFPEGMGYLPRKQALSRWYLGTKTFSDRRVVFRECAALIHREFGGVQTNWPLSYVDETLKNHLGPLDPKGERLAGMTAFLDELRQWMTPQDQAALDIELAKDRRLTLCGADRYIGVDQDGLCVEATEILARRAAPERPLRVTLTGVNPEEFPNRLAFFDSRQRVKAVGTVMAGSGPFSLALTLPPREEDGGEDGLDRLGFTAMNPVEITALDLAPE